MFLVIEDASSRKNLLFAAGRNGLFDE